MTPRIVLPEPPAAERERLEGGGVACWEQDVDIATYEPAPPDPFPVFFDRRVYQGSDGRVYPLPFVDRIEREPVVRSWRAIHLENAWLRLMLLPQLGGRIHVGYDKTRGYDFFYRNNVIKPALVGLAGPWVSGGVELNWPQHHRHGWYLPVEVHVERSSDGAVTVWHGDVDPLQRLSGLHGVRLRPDEASVELAVRLHNRTPEPQTFLWWANVAAAVHEDYQSFFPTDVHFVADHARRALTAFPAADRPYYGVDYPALGRVREGADRLDVYTNIPVPTSYMVTDTADEFFGGYDHRAGGGFVHWAPRGIAPGKKQWTWGNGEIGHAWDRQLTDDDGPYVELMAGVFTDNQPDFSYLAPGETRTFSQFWYPIQDVGVVHQATREAAVSVQVADERARIGIAVLRPRRVRVTVALVDPRTGAGGVVVHRETVEAAPGAPAILTCAVPGVAGRDGLVVTVEADDEVLVRWAAHPGEPAEPWLASVPPAPQETTSVDELLLTAQHLVQYRHPSRSPRPYLERVLALDPGDSRVHLLLAELDHTAARYDEALVHVEAAAARITRRNLNPRSGELSYRRGLVLERLGRLDEAHDAFVKAAWDGAYALAGHLGAARVLLRTGRAREALDQAELAAAADPTNPTAVAARVLALRRLGLGLGPADAALAEALRRDPLQPLLRAVAGQVPSNDPTAVLLLAHELAAHGEDDLAATLADQAAAAGPTAFGNAAPVALLLRARLFAAAGDESGAAAQALRVLIADRSLAFPWGLDDHDVLRWAGEHAPEPVRPVALGLLGSLLLGLRRGPDALVVLLAAVAAGSQDPVVLRNAALACANTGGDLARADELLGRSLEVAGPLGRLLYERDQLARLRGVGSARRLADLEASGGDLLARDDLALAYLDLLLDAGRVDEALHVLRTRQFQPFEGGEGAAIAAFDRACLARAAQLVDTDPAAATTLLDEGLVTPVRRDEGAGIPVRSDGSAEVTPANLGEGRHPGAPAAHRLVAAGDAHLAAGSPQVAALRWQRARDVGGLLAVAPRPARADDYWVGVAHLRLGELDGARAVWDALDATADALEQAPTAPDYFATSLPALLLFTVDDEAGRRAQVALLRGLAADGRTATAGLVEITRTDQESS